MNNGRKNNLKYSTPAILLAVLTLLTCDSLANYTNGNSFYNSLTDWQDTSRKATTDTIPRPKDSLVNRNDTFALKVSKDSLDAPVKYEAEDSVVVLVKEKK